MGLTAPSGLSNSAITSTRPLDGSATGETNTTRVQLLGSGAILREVIAAAQPLRPIIYVEQPPPEEGQFAPAGRFWQRLDP